MTSKPWSTAISSFENSIFIKNKYLLKFIKLKQPHIRTKALNKSISGVSYQRTTVTNKATIFYKLFFKFPWKTIRYVILLRSPNYTSPNSITDDNSTLSNSTATAISFNKYLYTVERDIHLYV